MITEQRSIDASAAAPPLTKILAVDDLAENLHSLKRILADVDAEVVTVQSGHGALAQILRHDFALILLDVMMPEMDGFETASLIRAHEASRHIPIIFVTAADREQHFEDRGYDVGAVDYLYKPIQPHVLLSKVRVFLQQALQQQTLSRSLQEIKQLRDHNELLLRSVNEGVFSFDLLGRITFANLAANRLLGATPGQLCGASATDFVYLSEDHQANSGWLRDVFASLVREPQGRANDQHWFQHAGGHLFPVEFTISGLYEQQNKLTGAVLVFQNISERKERDALQLASKYKSAFLANVSHELRSPLHSLLILANQLALNEERNLTADQVRSAQVIQQEGEDLLSLINDILDLSKVEAGKMSLQMEVVTISELMQHLAGQFAPLVAQKGLKCDWILSEDLPAALYTDRQRLLQILKNLLFNAVKFTDQGKITVHVMRATDVGPEVVAFSITDTGIGIDKAHQVEIFEAFQQIDVAFNRHYEGSGLGLAISRELSDLLNGYLRVQSEPGKGSCFTLYLPLKKSGKPIKVNPSGLSGQDRAPLVNSDSQPDGAVEMPPLAPQKIPQALPALAQGKTVLLIDSDMRSNFTLARLLRHCGFAVIKAENYQSGATRLAEARGTTVVIMALMSPLAKAEHMLSTALCSSDHVFVLFDSHLKHQADVLMQQGACACLPKPLDSDLFFTRLITALAEQSEGGQVNSASRGVKQ